MLDLQDPQSALRRLLLELGICDAPVIVVGNQRGDRFLALAGCEIDDPVDITLDKEREEVGAVRGRRRIGREGDHRLAGAAHQFRHFAHVRRKQRADHDFRPLRQRGLRGVARPVRGRMVVLDEDLDVGRAGFGIGEVSRVAQRLADEAGLAARRRQRQDQRDLDRAGADRVARGRRGAGQCRGFDLADRRVQRHVGIARRFRARAADRAASRERKGAPQETEEPHAWNGRSKRRTQTFAPLVRRAGSRARQTAQAPESSGALPAASRSSKRPSRCAQKMAPDRIEHRRPPCNVASAPSRRMKFLKRFPRPAPPRRRTPYEENIDAAGLRPGGKAAAVGA